MRELEDDFEIDRFCKLGFFVGLGFCDGLIERSPRLQVLNFSGWLNHIIFKIKYYTSSTFLSVCSAPVSRIVENPF